MVRVAVRGRVGIDGSGGGSCGKLLRVRRKSRGELDDEICDIRFFRCRATLRLDDWRVGGPQPASRDVECHSVLCVLLVVVLSRSPWSPFSTSRSGCLCAVEPARFQFSQCAPEGVAYYATGDVVFGRWLCRHLSKRLEMPCHHSRLGLNHRTSVSCSALWRSGTLKRFLEGVELFSCRCRLDYVALQLFPSVSVVPVGLYVFPWLGWIVSFPVPGVFLPDGGLVELVALLVSLFSVPPLGRLSTLWRSEVAVFVVGRCSRLVACDLSGCAEGCRRVVADSVGFVGVVRVCVTTLVGGCGVGVFGFAVCLLLGVPDKDCLVSCGESFLLASYVVLVAGALVLHLALCWVLAIALSVYTGVFWFLRWLESGLVPALSFLCAGLVCCQLLVGFVVVCGVESAGGWFSCWRLKKSMSRDVDVDLFMEECLCDVEPARFQFSHCAPEGVAYYAIGSCVLYRLWVRGQLACVEELRYSVLALLDCCQ
ncbi:hypothetical protein Taro_009689 [Colocasia esculenta]|uniref:Uncharacterized protein n=1 Tax=Colocasia esculenta TaxID=4460 RepID=A0A843U0X3_COLES|nr:hypothetical protein [Colocasia esculenta]